MEYPEYYKSRNRHTSIILGFENFTTIGQSIESMDQIQLTFIGSCCTLLYIYTTKY